MEGEIGGESERECASEIESESKIERDRGC